MPLDLYMPMPEFPHTRLLISGRGQLSRESDDCHRDILPHS